MNRKDKLVAEELRLAGAKESELNQLTEVADRLHRLNTPSASLKQAKQVRPGWHLAPLGAALIVGVLLGANVVAYAQTSLPGNWLYPSKRLSEKVAVAFDPGYRATLMMRRSQEVKELVDRHAGKPVVLATLADYKTEAAAYKSADYAAFEFCESNLKQAAAAAPTPERAAINGTLASLQT